MPREGITFESLRAVLDLVLSSAKLVLGRSHRCAYYSAELVRSRFFGRWLWLIDLTSIDDSERRNISRSCEGAQNPKAILAPVDASKPNPDSAFHESNSLKGDSG